MPTRLAPDLHTLHTPVRLHFESADTAAQRLTGNFRNTGMGESNFVERAPFHLVKGNNKFAQRPFDSRLGPRPAGGGQEGRVG